MPYALRSAGLTILNDAAPYVRTSILLPPHSILRNTSVRLPLYKMMSARNLSAFLADGTLRIGTFWDFANEEAYGRGRGDSNEGSRMIVVMSEALGMPLGITISSVNSWMFCTTKLFSKELLAAFQCDRGFEITSWLFFYELALAMSKFSRATFIEPVSYKTEIQLAANIEEQLLKGVVTKDLDLPMCSLVKDEDFAEQQEVRAIWEPTIERSQLNRFLEGDEDPTEANRIVGEFTRDRLGFLSREGVGRDVRPIMIKVPEARRHVRVLDYKK